MRLFKEEGKVPRAKFYPRIIPLTNFLTNVSLIIYFANKFSWTNACFKGHFIVQVLMQLQPCGHSRWVLLLKMPDGKFLSWLLFNNLSKLKLVYFQLHGIRQQSSRNKSARKRVVTSLLQKNKRQTKQKTKASESLAFLCANKQTKTNEQGKVWVPICFRFTWRFPIMIYSPECPISLFNL